jgi:hypothetical protein
MIFRRYTPPPWQQLVILVVVTATVIAAFKSSDFAQAANDRLDRVTAAQRALDQDQADFDAQINCTQKVLSDTLGALKARAAFAETSAQIEETLLEAQQAFLTVAGSDTGLKAFNDYVKAVNTAITAIKDQLRVRELNPFPTRGEILACATATATSG